MTKTVINDIQLLYEGLNENSPFPAAAHGSNYNPNAQVPKITLKGPPIAPAPISKIASPSEGPAINTDEELENIARDVLGIKTLKVRNMDDLDFYEVHVANLKKALQQAFQAGQLSK